MKFLPYRRLIITTDLPKEEVVRRLKDQVGPTKRENFARVDKNIFSGRLGNDRFDLTLITDHRNSFTPEVTGTISEKDKKTELTVRLKSNIVVLWFTGVFMLIGLSMFVYEIVDFSGQGDFDWITFWFIVLPYGICWFGFNLDADKSVDGLIKITKGRIN